MMKDKITKLVRAFILVLLVGIAGLTVGFGAFLFLMAFFALSAPVKLGIIALASVFLSIGMVISIVLQCKR